MATYQILYWHDIPVQVKAKTGRERASKPLSNRFQVAIDNAAMAAGLVGSDAYTDLFRWSAPQEREGTPEAIVTAVAAELEAKYDKIEWRATAVQLKNNKMHKKILVGYATGSGSTREVAQAIGDVLGESGVPVDVLAVQTVSSVTSYSAVVLGSSIRLGRWLPEAVEFLKTFKDELQNRTAAYFTTCLTIIEDTEHNRQIVLDYLEPILQLAPAVKPVGLGLFAGSLSPEQEAIPSHAGLGPIGDYRDWAAIKAWAEAVRPAILAGGVGEEGERPYNLNQVTLSFSDLSGTDLSQSTLWQADLQETRLRAANLHGADLRETDLTKADLHQADLHEAGLGWANLSRSRLTDANLRQANLIGAKLKKADLGRADLRQAVLNGANLRKANLRQANLSQADLNWANLSKTDLRQADLREANLSWADLRGADLSQAKLEKARYNELTKWPDGFDVKAAGCILFTQQA